MQLRRICYTDPRDGSTYTYLTNEMTVPAYQLVIIYLCRWEIEKVFHQLKSKMEERKSWASSPEAKRAHGQFECLAHEKTHSPSGSGFKYVSNEETVTCDDAGPR